MSRYAFFTMTFCISFGWYWFPGFIFSALSYFSFPCWIKPESKVVNQIFGMSSGMGLLPITFDWSQISYVGSPLLILSWAVLNVSISLVFWIWIVSVACYYTNVWNTGYLPFQSSQVFDNTGNTYKVKKIVNAASDYKLDIKKYLAYSPVHHDHQRSLLCPGYETGLLLSCKRSSFPLQFDHADTPRIPQRKLFIVQCVGMLVSTLSSLGVLNWAMNYIAGICTSAAVNGFSCPYSSIHFNTSLIWGAVGPRRYFSSYIGHSAFLYFFIIGAILPIPVYYMARRYPKSLWRMAVVGLAFGWLIRKRLPNWWSRYNIVLSSAMDSSVGIAGALIFLTIYLTGANRHFNWWGTEVHKEQNTCDWKGCAYLSVPKGRRFGM
ncbi:hypothetical protein N7463_009618 [Penicillium fimorum]|uniref:Oligopeptide transporter OPT superfamily n=1 Tax=Penicillium fimorum TaxID=1882269 RepID=A0A9W9XIC0_9EURO|nr:hypothetical protein N7463_009618 [Penicillium fimorum]